ncbi:hypothetical protein D3C72_1233100 [compost metagenome]
MLPMWILWLSAVPVPLQKYLLSSSTTRLSMLASCSHGALSAPGPAASAAPASRTSPLLLDTDVGSVVLIAVRMALLILTSPAYSSRTSRLPLVPMIRAYFSPLNVYVPVGLL